mgnify:CR=1 FL=1
MVTTYYLNLVAGNLLGTKTSPGIPATYYVGLSKSAPTVAGGNVSEPSGGGTLNGVIKNGQEVAFAEASGNWGAITHVVVYDTATGGNLLMYSELPAAKTVTSGDQARFKVGSLIFTVKAA